ncbi:MAG: glycosyltransferase family 4 protein [Candidatus Muirbacterium halophilum]|nr:glycosyltransferase family 4 protein [Candidatus Muirbacterium halophilum]MCK9476613.1 glycosyltransferase family 4 protein [Candidatus Muirbacterium halophilum]
MRIMFVCSSSNFFGGEKVLMNLAERFKKDGNSVLIIIPQKGDFSNKLEGILDYSIVKIINSVSFSAIPDFYKEIKEFNPDIIHSHGYVSNQISRIMSFLTKVPVISVLHVLQNYKYNELGLKAYFYRIYDKFTNIISYKNINIAVSSPVANTANYLKPIVIPNGMDFPSISYNYPNKIIKFAMIGRIVNIKGIENVLNTFLRIKDNYKITPELLIIGKDITKGKKWENKFREFVTKNNLSNIRFIDFLDNIEEIYSKFDCLIHASFEGHEGCPLVLIEAMLRKKLIIFSDIKASKYVMKDKGIMFSHKNTKTLDDCVLNSLKQSSNKLKVLIENQYNFAIEEYSFEKMYKNHKLIIFQKLSHKDSKKDI